MDEDLRQLLRDLNGLLQTLLSVVGVTIGVKAIKAPKKKPRKRKR